MSVYGCVQSGWRCRIQQGRFIPCGKVNPLRTEKMANFIMRVTSVKCEIVGPFGVCRPGHRIRNVAQTIPHCLVSLTTSGYGREGGIGNRIGSSSDHSQRYGKIFSPVD